MHFRKTLLVLAVAGAAMFNGCNKSESTTPAGSTSAGTGKKVKLAFVTNNASDFWAIAKAGCNKAAEENPNIEVDFQIVSDGTAAGQKAILDNLLVRGEDGIAISPKDPANQTEMLNDAASKVLLFTTDSDAPSTNRSCYIGTSNLDAGKQAGELIKKAIPNGGKIVMFVGTLDAQNAKDRKAGIEQVLVGSNIQLIDTRTDEADPVRAKANVQDILVKDPDVACLVGLYSYNGPAIVNAVRDANKTGSVKIVCFDEEDDTLAGVKSGDVFATVVQQPFEFGHLCMINMAKVLSGDKSVIPDSKQIIVPTKAITKDNVDAFKAELMKQRGH